MSIHRRAAKRDGNEPEIIEALREAGASVCQLSGVGVADLLCGFRGETYLLEVKARKGKLTDAQVKFIDGWQGSTVHVTRTVDAALKAIGAIS